MDEHRWKVHGREAIADRLGIRYQTVVGGDIDYIVGGTVANEEILRLVEGIEGADALLRRAEKVINQGLAENARLRQEVQRLKVEAAFAPDLVLKAAREGESARIRQKLLEELPVPPMHSGDAFHKGWAEASEMARAALDRVCPAHTGAPGKNSDTPADFRSSGE